MYAELADIKAHCGITVTTDDDLLTRLIAAATSAIDKATGRVFESTTATSRNFGPAAVDCRYLSLDTDLCAITSVVNGDGTTINASDYITYPRNISPWFGLELRDNSWYASRTEDVVITGHWSYSQEAPDDIVQACIRLVSYWWRLKDAQVFDTTANPETGQVVVPKGIPNDVMGLLKPYKRVL